jgi:hypothetical protein
VEADQFNRINRALADPRRMEILEPIAADSQLVCAALASESVIAADQFPPPQGTLFSELPLLSRRYPWPGLSWRRI